MQYCNGGAVVAGVEEFEGQQVRASPASLCYVLEQDTLNLA